MNETEKIARDICEFSGIFVTCDECCKRKRLIAPTAARRWTERRKNEREQTYAFIAFHRHRRA